MRELTPEDLGTLVGKRPPQGPVVQRLRDSHHRVARLFASGMKATQVAHESGYSINRVVSLSNDPAFQELIAQYRDDVTQAFRQGIDEYARVATENMLKAERQIADKLDEADAEGELLPVRDLIAISRDAADRFGYGKRATQVNLNVDFAAQLDRAIKRSREPITIEAEASVPARSASLEGELRPGSGSPTIPRGVGNPQGSETSPPLARPGGNSLSSGEGKRSGLGEGKQPRGPA